MNEINLKVTIDCYLRNAQSAECRAFMEGARSIMTALQLAPVADYPRILSTKNQQHIIALLVQSADQQAARRRDDAKQVLRLYEFKKSELLAFLFDLAKIDPDSGRALNLDGDPVEDEMFRLLPGKTRSRWPQYTIEHCLNNKSVSRKQYDKMGERERDDYFYRRFFHLSLHGHTALKISDADTYLMEELIRQAILIGDPEINRRFLTEIYSSPDGKKYAPGRLYNYRDAILDALTELYRQQGDYEHPPMLLAQVRSGHIKTAGQLLIAQLQELCSYAKANQLLRYSAADIRRWTRLIEATNGDKPPHRTDLLTFEDIRTYRNVQGNYMRKAAYHMDGSYWFILSPQEEENFTDINRELFFWHIFMPEACRRLQQLLDQLLQSRDLIMSSTTPAVFDALHELDECLRKHVKDFENSTPQ